MQHKVSIQGIKGSFHEEAAQRYFGDQLETIECLSFRETCSKLHSGKADYAIMAIENALAGSLLPNYNLIRDFNLRIVGEVYLPIKLNLLVYNGTPIENIKRVISHPIAIQQCQEFLEEHPHLEVIEKADTAACAKTVSDGKLEDTAAIANKEAAKIYGLNTLYKSIETNKKNYTRFLVLLTEDKYKENPSNVNKATLSFHCGDSVGSLAKALNIFTENNINLTKIQNTPVIGKPHKDNFFVDLIWNAYADFEKALINLTKIVSNLTILGEYKQDENFNLIKQNWK